MNLIDTNALTYLIENGLVLTQRYYLVPEVESEAELTQMIFNQSLGKNFLSVKLYSAFNEVRYYDHFNLMLNKHKGRSFFNMTGFGDISILATVHCILEQFSIEKTSSLFPQIEKIDIFTNDGRLRSKINSEFEAMEVYLYNYHDLK